MHFIQFVFNCVFSQVLLRARPTVGKSDLEVFERFTQEFGEEAS